MNKIILTSVIASTLIMAGGDIAPVEPSISVPTTVTDMASADSLGANFYVGAGYTMPFATQNSLTGGNSFENGDSTGMFLIGSEFNKYFGIEARWTPIEGTNDVFGLYAKPEWKITENFNIYALLGAGKIERQDLEFQAGLGLGYDFNEKWGLFADYIVTDFETSLTNLDGSTDTGTSGNAAFGVSYTF